MDDLLHAATKLQWTDETASVEEILEKYGLPQIVKTTPETSKIYDLPEDEAVLLVTKRNPVRLSAQTVEEGHYVMGKQLDIPSEFSGVFKICCDYEREEIVLQTFRSIQEISDAFPPKVYVQEQLTLTLASDDNSGKFVTVVLEKGDELTILNRLESPSGLGIISKPASRFISRVRRLQNSFLAVHCTRLNESLSLPMSIQGWFATRPPLFVHLMERKGIISLQQIMEQADFPLTVAVSTNSTRSTKDEFVLRSGMRLKLLGLEEHNLVLAVAPFQKIIEFSSSGVSFILPAVLTNLNNMEKEQVAMRNQYQTFVQNAFMQSKLQNSPSNIEEYCTAVRFHVPRNRNPTNPIPLNSNAYLRNLTLSAQQQRRPSPSKQGISAIQLLTSQPADGMLQREKRMSSRQSSSFRRQLPTPDTPPASPASSNNPPLPPRNSPLPATPTHHGTASNAHDYPSFAPPVPPKNNRAPPPPSFEPPTLASVMKGTPNQASEIPSRQPPFPTAPSASQQQSVSHTTNGYDPSEEENIFEEFVPRAPLASTTSVDNGCTSFNTQDAILTSSCKGEAVATSSSSILDQITLSSPSTMQTRSDSPCFVLQPTPAADVFIPNHYENHGLNLPLNSMPNERSFASTAPEPNLLSRETNKSSSSDQSCSSTDSDKSNSSAHGSMTFPVNGIGTDSDLAESDDAQSSGGVGAGSVQSIPKQYFPAPSNWHPPCDVSSLNVDEVTKSLRYIGIHEKVVLSFRNEMIDGCMLIELTDEILEEDFQLSKLHRFKIRRFIQGWRPKLPVSS